MLKALELCADQFTPHDSLKNCEELERHGEVYKLKDTVAFPIRVKENWTDNKTDKTAILSYVKQYLQLQSVVKN